jgi:hypothetical protein
MDYLNKIKSLDQTEVKSFLKEQLKNDDFVAAVLDNKETLIPILLKNKLMSDEILELFTKKTEDLSYIVSNLIEYNFIPSINFFEKLGSNALNDEALFNLIKSFPTVSLSLQFLLKSLNLNFKLSSAELVKKNKEFQRSDIFHLLLSLHVDDESLFTIMLNDEKFTKEVWGDVSYASCQEDRPYSRCFFDFLIANLKDLSSQKISALSSLDISSSTLKRVILEATLTEDSYFYNKKTKTTIAWSPELESIDDEFWKEVHFSKFLIEDVPEGSKFRLQWIRNSPSESSLIELLMLAQTYPSESVMETVLRQDLNFIKKVDMNNVEKFISPALFANIIASADLEKRTYCFEIVSSKYKPALRKIIPNDMVKNEASNRKSFFVEVLQSIDEANLENFRFFTAKSYPLEKFSEDSHQSSKQRSCELVTAEEVFLIQLTKEEFLTLAKSHVNFNLGYGALNPLSYELTLSEAGIVGDKLFDDKLFAICSEKAKLLLDSLLDNESVPGIFEENKDFILGDKLALKNYFIRVKKADYKFSVLEIVALAKIMDGEELIKLANPVKQIELADEDSYDLIGLVSKNGVFYLKESEVLLFLKNKEFFSKDQFLNRIIDRNPELGKKILDAYFKGNKYLSELAGFPVKAVRLTERKQKFENLRNILGQDESAAVERAFSNGGNIDIFKNSLLDWIKSLRKFAKGRVIVIDEEKARELSTFGELSDLNFEIRSLKVDASVKHQKKRYENISILHLESEDYVNDDIQNFAKLYNVEIVRRPDEIVVESLDEKIERAMIDESSVNIQALLDEAERELDYATVSFLILTFLLDHGLILTNSNIEIILNNTTDEKMVQLIVARIGSLAGFIFHKELDHATASYGLLVTKLGTLGMLILTPKEFEKKKIYDKLKTEGADFSPMRFPASWSFQEKVELLKFIENEIDPNYNKLNLISSSLAQLNVLYPYSSMKSLFSLNDEDVVSLLCIQPQLAKNKKLMKLIRDFLAVDGGFALAYKVEKLKKLYDHFNPTVELETQDFLNLANMAEIELTQEFNTLSLNALDSLYTTLMGHSFFLLLKGAHKSDISRFIRSVNQAKDSLVKDTFEMITRCFDGIKDLGEQIFIAKSVDPEDEAIGQLQGKKDILSAKVKEFAAINDIVDIHDRLVPLLQILETNNKESIRQDRFKELQNSTKMVKKLGHRLYFPKSRGELSELGSKHGWCVGSSQSYGNNVKDKRDVLVGLCDKDKEPSIDSVLALAYYVREGEDFSLSELKWSIRVTGKKNKDAISDFNHEIIRTSLVEHLKEYYEKIG